LLEEFKNQTNMLTSSFYKPAKLYFANKDTSKEWFVYYYYLIPGRNAYKRFKLSLDMNRIKNANERYAYGKEVERFMNQKLARGYNPFKAINEESSKPLVIAKQLEIIVKEEMRQSSKNKINSYNEQLNRFIKFIYSEELQDKNLHVVEECKVSPAVKIESLPFNVE